MEKLKRYQDIEDIVYDMMDNGIENEKIEIKNEYHIDGASDKITQDIIIIVQNKKNTIIDEILMTRETEKGNADYSLMDIEAEKEIEEIKEIIRELIG